LERYLGLVERLGLYPGSPTLIRAMLRETDRLACCELHPDDAMTLRRQFRHDPQVEVHARSGWEALGGLLPPKEKRGLVLIDPPFESKDEFFALSDGLQRGHERFGHGVFAGWYPVKQMASVREFHAGLATSGIRDIIALELHLRDTTNPDRLNGCGLIVINSPYQFENRAQSVAAAVLEGLGDDEVGAGTAVIRLADE
jgi:23S rRNA (adenine2030-N6)-methyltransferase